VSAPDNVPYVDQPAIGHCTNHAGYQFGCPWCRTADCQLRRASGLKPWPMDVAKVATMLHGFTMRVEDMSRGSFSDEAAHRFLAAIHEEAAKVLAVLNRPDLLAEAFGDV
jgi:hypothetical protein